MSHPVFDVAGRIALVTGSSRGIGKALARGLLEAGCTVVLNGRDTGTLEAARDELAADFPERVHTAAFDVTDSAAVEAHVTAVEQRVGPIDVLVNNTGTQQRAPFTEFTDEQWHRLLDTNLTGSFLVGRSVARRMTPRRRGKIVNICSLQSEAARPGIAPYSATKGGLKMLTKGMCADLGPHGIQVNGIGPGYFATDLNAALVADEEFSAWVRRRTPAGRWGEVQDLVGALVFLSSPASDFVSGQVLYVDGGMLSVL
ncbi:SDR family oxidoreductase [Streptomyces sp. NPDC004629]|uniref:SDR family oxidoreductase n=1 Tax=Streptomyces sp. NPDC004629 TaxID=3364705 RepID=UPI00368BBD16